MIAKRFISLAVGALTALLVVSGAQAQIRGLNTTQVAGTITTHGTFQQALAAKDTRNGCLIQNTSADDEYVFFGPTASATTAKSFKIAAGNAISCAIGGIADAKDNIAITSGATDGATYVLASQ